jgi:hypothetical protein
VALLKKDPRIVPDMGVRVSFLEKAAPVAANAPPPGVLVPAAAIANRDGRRSPSSSTATMSRSAR